MSNNLNPTEVESLEGKLWGAPGHWVVLVVEDEEVLHVKFTTPRSPPPQN